MALRDIQIPQDEIECLGTTIPVRPLTIKQVTTLIQRHGDALLGAWTNYSPLINTDDFDLAKGASLALINECADAVAEMIAMSAGEPDMVEVAAALPADVQLRLASTIVSMTANMNDASKFLEDLRDAMATAGHPMFGTAH